MFVKICANTNLEDALLAVEMGADAVGFVFAPSKRQVTVGKASEIVDGLPESVEKVGVLVPGVFPATDARDIALTVTAAGLTAVQLHGAFDSALVRALDAEFDGGLKIIQTVAYAVDAVDRMAADEAFEAALRAVFAEPAVWAVLVDAAKSGVSGGLGVAFDWAQVAGIVERASGDREPRPRVILAGGLRAETVGEAIASFAPWGVDVASGVEASAGKKDPERLRAFIANARATER